MANRVAKVREIGGNAAACPVGGMLAFKLPSGALGAYWRRVEDDPEEPGMMMLKEADRDDGALFCAEAGDLKRYVRIERVEEVVS